MKRAIAILTLILLSGCSLPRLSVFSTAPEQIDHSRTEVVKPVVQSPALKALSSSPIVTSLNSKDALPIVPLNITPEVRREIERYTSRNRGCIVRALNNRKLHLDIMREIFRDEGVPEELINVALLESQFNPTAKSPAGAKGMWQFMAGTGRLYGLEVSKKKDERTDPILSTIAAAKHLRDLYQDFNDWHLALAAYNAGPYRVTKALEQSGADDFWELARKGAIPGETSNFVPKFIASTLIMQHPAKFGFADAQG